MSKSRKNSILVLDDDPTFRSLIVNLLKPQGYRVVEASSPEEANNIFTRMDTVLAIVDYRMPQMDGMTWISHLRDAGCKIPMVFCTAVPFEPKLFSWLRNVLGVALIVQKPIIPSAFLQQIESLLPGYEKHFEDEGIADLNSPGHHREFAASQMTDEAKELAKKNKIEEALRQARIQYQEQLNNDWKLLVSNIENRNKNPENREAVMNAIRLAHSIRGTAGSLGLEEIGTLAGKMEDFLLSLDPTDSTAQEIYWSEINRLVAQGSGTINKVLADLKKSEPQTVNKRVLILSHNDNVIGAAREEETRQLADVQGTDTPSTFLKYASENKIDAVIIDTVNNADEAMKCAAAVRNLPGNESIPIGIICLDDKSFSKTEQLYIGSSSTITGPVDGKNLRVCIKNLLAVNVPGKPRVFVVDDDEVLCRFAAGVISDQHMETFYVTNPTKVKDEMERFDPDLVLLDVMMPVLSGYEVCRQIREESKWSDVPILFLTSKTSQDARAAAFAVGANDFLTKPILTEELIARVSAQIALASRKRKDRTRDPETKMLTGEAFMSEAQELLDPYNNYKQPLSVALLEIDDFDNTIVSRGFHGASEVTRELGTILKERFPAESLRSKWSNSGYAIAVPGAHTQDLASAIKKTLSVFSKIQFSGTTESFSTTFSFGVASSIEGGNNLEDIIKKAYRQLKGGKREKNGAVSVN